MPEKILHTLQLLHNLTFLPLQYYRDNTCLAHFPQQDILASLTEVHRGTLRHIQPQPAYMLSGDFLYYGIVSIDSSHYILAGPVSSIPIERNVLPGIMAESSIPFSEKEEVWQFFRTTPLFSFDQFTNALALLHEMGTGSPIHPRSFFLPGFKAQQEKMERMHSSRMYQARELSDFHNTYYFEQTLYKYVAEGNIPALEQLTRNSIAMNIGKIGENTLRQMKNIFITSITLLTRYSISGGLDVETAYQLSDAYIQESEKAQQMDTIQQLNQTALFDFARRVAASKIPAGMSRDVYQSIQFISTHLNQPLSTSDVSRAIGKSRSYISRKFKQELGFQLGDFIMRKKLEEGRSLLAHTDKSISEISAYLCFSSQSYFQNVFKKKYGITPLHYRRTHNHSG